MKRQSIPIKGGVKSQTASASIMILAFRSASSSRAGEPVASCCAEASSMLASSLASVMLGLAVASPAMEAVWS